MVRFALSARTSTDDLQDPADSLRWQRDTAARLIAPHGEIVTVYHDIDKSRSLPWDRRPEDSRILRDLKDVRRGWAARIEATQREKSAAESVLATAPPAPAPLTLEQVLETLSALRDLPELLGRIEQADRAALYQALGLTVQYRRVGTSEEVKLSTTLQSVDLERVGAHEGSKNSQVNGLQGVDLERVGGGT